MEVQKIPDNIQIQNELMYFLVAQQTPLTLAKKHNHGQHHCRNHTRLNFDVHEEYYGVSGFKI